MSEQGQPVYGYGGNPPYGPPPRRNNKNVVIAVAGVVVVAVAAILAIVLLSGSDKAPVAAGSTSSTPTPLTPSVTVAPPGASSSSSSTGSASGLTCAGVQSDSTFYRKLTLHTGGAAPSGVMLPNGEPGLICSGVTTATPAAPVTALIYDNVQLSDYVAQMTGAGWKDRSNPPYHVLGNPRSKYQVVAVAINGDLVVVYGHS